MVFLQLLGALALMWVALLISPSLFAVIVTCVFVLFAFGILATVLMVIWPLLMVLFIVWFLMKVTT